MSSYPYPNMKYYPQFAVIELSLLCNMRCKHCGSSAGVPRKNELTIPEWLDIAAQLIAMGLQAVTLIGGEILLVKDWEKLALKFAEAGVAVNIITNAYNINDENIQKIKDARLDSIGVSVDGMEAGHNNIRGKQDSFAKILNAFDLFNAAKIHFSVVTTLLASNFDELEDMYNLFSEKGAFAWQLQLAAPMGNALGRSELLIDPKNMPVLINFIKEKKKQKRLTIYVGDNLRFEENCTTAGSYYSDEGVDNEWVGCMAGLRAIGIDSIGNVRGCESLYSDEFIEGNLRNESLATIWNKDCAFAYNRNFKPEMLRGKCSICDQRLRCAGGCRQLSYFTSGCCHESIYCNYSGLPRFLRFLDKKK